MTSAAQIIRAAMPDASDMMLEHILWGRTPFPVGRVSPRALFKAASGFRRACDHGLVLCEHCHRLAAPGKYECVGCREALERTKALARAA